MARLTHFRSPLLRLALPGALILACTAGAVAQSTNPIKLMKGVVSDAQSGKPIDGGRLLVYHGSKSEPVAQSRINPSTGAFQVVLGPSMEYRFIIESPRFLRGEALVRTPDGKNYEEVVRNLTVQPIPIGQSLFRGRAFDANASAVKLSGDLTKALAFMKDVQAATLTITVLPDPATTKSSKAAKPPKRKKGKKGAQTAADDHAVTAAAPADASASLAQARAQALKAFFQKEGISLTRITWRVPQSASEARTMARGKDNLVIEITGVDVEEVEED